MFTVYFVTFLSFNNSINLFIYINIHNIYLIFTAFIYYGMLGKNAIYDYLVPSPGILDSILDAWDGLTNFGWVRNMDMLNSVIVTNYSNR